MEIKLTINTEKMKDAGFEITENYTIEDFFIYEKSLLKTIDGEHVPQDRRKIAWDFLISDMMQFVDAVEI